ncbi:MAG: CsgG/HfaB family protein [Chlamydiota bacterium]|nr:CsgG/HfaB family protein [Chlamydiota bacterium]
MIRRIISIYRFACVGLILLSGCATTQQTAPRPVNNLIDPHEARIILSDPPALADMIVEVRDNGVLIGELGHSDELVWDRPTGLMELTGHARNSLPPHSTWTLEPMKLAVGGGRTYWFKIDGSGYIFCLYKGEPLPLTPGLHQKEPSYNSLYLSSDAFSLPEPKWLLENIAVAELMTETLVPEEARTLSEKLRTTMVKTEYFRVLSRNDMADILEEQNFQQSDLCDDSVCLIKMGKILAVQKIIGGAIGKVGKTFYLSLRLVNVETGEIELTSERKFIGENDELLDFIELVGKDLAREYAKIKS